MIVLLKLLVLCMALSFSGLSVIWRIGFGYWPWSKPNIQDVRAQEFVNAFVKFPSAEEFVRMWHDATCPIEQVGIYEWESRPGWKELVADVTKRTKDWQSSQV